MEEAEEMREEEMAGIREQMAAHVARIEKQIEALRLQLRKQEDVIASKLKQHQQAGEDASTILGDKLQQKMDSVTFSQERMKRQLDDLQVLMTLKSIFRYEIRLIDYRTALKALRPTLSMSGSGSKILRRTWQSSKAPVEVLRKAELTQAMTFRALKRTWTLSWAEAEAPKGRGTPSREFRLW